MTRKIWTKIDVGDKISGWQNILVTTLEQLIPSCTLISLAGVISFRFGSGAGGRGDGVVGML